MNNAKVVIIIVISIYLSMSGLSAAISTYYAFTETQSQWESVLGNYATDAMTDEGITEPIDIGFTFTYGANTYTQVKISSNGWLNLGTNLTLPYYGNDLSYLNIRPILTPLWDDLSLETGGVQYAMYGTAPYRVFYVQWLAAKWTYSAANEFSFMIRLHESGQIDFIYGPSFGVPYNPSASIGINMVPGGSGNYYSILPGLPAVASSNTSYNNIAIFPDEGVTYNFMAKSQQAADIAAVNLYGLHYADTGHVGFYTLTVGNAGTQPIAANTAVAYLMNGEAILDIINLPALSPGSFADAEFMWLPTSPGNVSLTGKVQLANDADSLNDITLPLEFMVYTANPEGDLAPSVPDLRLQCNPNPFRDKMSVDYDLKQAGQVRIELFNLKGQKVCRLEEGLRTPGLHHLNWNARDESGKSVPGGIYFIRASSESGAVSKKLILLR
jgi:hypothetical protein